MAFLSNKHYSSNLKKSYQKVPIFKNSIEKRNINERGNCLEDFHVYEAIVETQKMDLRKKTAPNFSVCHFKLN